MQGAEPLYLHILRPLIKPYVDTMDPLLDLARDIGDFLFALSQVPLNYVLSLSGLPWHTEENESSTEFSETAASGSTTRRSSSNSNIPIAAKVYTAVESNPTVAEKRPASTHSVSGDRVRRRRPVDSYESMSIRGGRSKSTSMTTLPHYPSNTVGRANGRSLSNNSRKTAYQIWYPPPPAYEEEPRQSRLSVRRSGMVSASTPNLIQPGTPSPVITVTESTAVQSEDWRLYPAFPSAYPPTPLPASHSLPGITPHGDGLSPTQVIPPILEDIVMDGSRKQAYEPTPPSSSGGSSDEHSSLSGVQGGVEGSHQNARVSNQDEDENSYTDSEDDDFDVTLRTPYRSFPSNASSSAASLRSVLTTNDNASSLRTRASSDSTHSLHTSDSSSHAGRKRSYPTVTLKGRKAIVTSPKNTTIRGKAGTTASFKHDSDFGASDSDHVHGHDTDSEDSDAGAKRRKVLEPTRRTTHLRPTARPTTIVGRPPLATRIPSGPNRGKAIAPAQRARTRGGSRGSLRTVGATSREDTLHGHTRRSTSKMPSQEPDTYHRTGTVRNKT